MSQARDTILGRVRSGIPRGDEEAARRAVADRLAGHARGLQPRRTAIDQEALVDLFAALPGNAYEIPDMAILRDEYHLGVRPGEGAPIYLGSVYPTTFEVRCGRG